MIMVNYVPAEGLALHDVKQSEGMVLSVAFECIYADKPA